MHTMDATLAKMFLEKMTYDRYTREEESAFLAYCRTVSGMELKKLMDIYWRQFIPLSAPGRPSGGLKQLERKERHLQMQKLINEALRKGRQKRFFWLLLLSTGIAALLTCCLYWVIGSYL